MKDIFLFPVLSGVVGSLAAFMGDVAAAVPPQWTNISAFGVLSAGFGTLLKFLIGQLTTKLDSIDKTMDLVLAELRAQNRTSDK